MKKVLVVASVVSFIEWFNQENIHFLKETRGCEVHVACNFDNMQDTDVVRTRKYIEKLKKNGVFLHNVQFARSPFRLENIGAYRALRRIIQTQNFDLIHCHTPTASVLTRLASMQARRKGCCVMYTCHGFHFHNASNKKNWVIFYPIERFLARFCDYIITINQEDFQRAKTFPCENVRYIPGVGVDIAGIQRIEVNAAKKKEEIGVPMDKLLLVSAGELIPRKNHEVIIKALAKLNNKDLYYAIAGKGPLKESLEQLAEKLGIRDRILFLGFRTDVFELYNAADISAFPSKIEGLGLAGIEAMAAGLPLVSSNVHGILDYVKDGETGYALSPDDVDGFAEAINKLASDSALREKMREKCLKAVEPFGKENALQAMWNIYSEILN